MNGAIADIMLTEADIPGASLWDPLKVVHNIAAVYSRGGSGGPAGTVWAGPLFEFFNIVTSYKNYQLITFQKPEQHLSNTVYINHHIILLFTHIT